MVLLGRVMHTQTFHKHDERDDLLAMASDVFTSPASPVLSMTARDAAKALVGVAGWISRRVGVDGMQERMGLLARHGKAWSSDFSDLPTGIDGRVDEHVLLIAVVASGILPLAGAARVRAAMAFWATERDASVWQQVAA